MPSVHLRHLGNLACLNPPQSHIRPSFWARLLAQSMQCGNSAFLNLPHAQSRSSPRAFSVAQSKHWSYCGFFSAPHSHSFGFIDLWITSISVYVIRAFQGSGFVE